MSSMLLGGVACSADDGRGAPAPVVAPTTTTATWDPPVPGTTVVVDRPLPMAAAPVPTWTELFVLDDVGPGAEAVVPIDRGRWVVLDPTRAVLHEASFDARAGEWRWSELPLPPGVDAATPRVAGSFVVPVADGVLVPDILGDPEVVATDEVPVEWVYSDGVSLFSDDGRALDLTWNNEVTLRRVDSFRTPSDDRFRVHADGPSVLVDLFDLDRRVRVDVGEDAEVELDADLAGTVHVVVRAGARAGYLSITRTGDVSAVEAVPAGAHVRVVPNTTTVALSATTPDGLRVWTRVAPDTVGIVSADLPEETCQWVRDYAVEYGGASSAPPMTLDQGSVPGFPEGMGGAWLASEDGVFRPDLDGDGARDAAFVVWCSAGGSGHNAEIHTIDSGGRSLGWFEVGEDAGTRGMWSFTVDGTDVVVEYPTWDTGEGGCCATVHVTDRYRWTNGDFVRVARRTWSAADAAQDILEVFNRGEDGLLVADPDAFVGLTEAREAHGELSGCTTTDADGGDRTCVITAGDVPYRLTLTWIDVDEWRATALGPAGT